MGAVALLAVVLGGGTASAGVDNTSSITDVKGNRIEVFQADTAIHVFPPLDSSPLSVEFFHDGVAGVKIDGPDAASFTGTKLTIGYQIGYPIALTGATVVLNSPGLDWQSRAERTSGSVWFRISNWAWIFPMGSSSAATSFRRRNWTSTWRRAVSPTSRCSKIRSSTVPKPLSVCPEFTVTYREQSVR